MRNWAFTVWVMICLMSRCGSPFTWVTVSGLMPRTEQVLVILMTPIFVNYSKMVMELMNAGAIPSREVELALYHDKGVEVMAMVNGESAMEMMWSNQLTAPQHSCRDRTDVFVMTHLPRPE